MHLANLLVFFVLALLFLAPAFYVWRPWAARLQFGRVNTASLRLWRFLRRENLLAGIGAMFIMIGSAVVIAMVSTACSAGQVVADATAVGDISGAVCAELAANLQKDPEWLQFVCSMAPKLDGTGTPKTFYVRVRRDTAAKFAEEHCVVAKPVTVSP